MAEVIYGRSRNAGDDDELASGFDALGGAAKGGVAGAKLGGPIGAVIGTLAGAATPFLSKAIGGMFGVTDAEDKEKAAQNALHQVATGGTTQAQAGIAYARGRTLQDLQGLANRGTAQQQAGLQRQVMHQAPEVQARYASGLADLRSREQENARNTLVAMEAKRAGAEAQRLRQSAAGAVSGVGSALTAFGTAAMTPDPAGEAAKAKEFKDSLNLGEFDAGANTSNQYAPGMTSSQAGEQLFGAAPSNAADVDPFAIDPSVTAAVNDPSQGAFDMAGRTDLQNQAFDENERDAGFGALANSRATPGDNLAKSIGAEDSMVANPNMYRAEQPMRGSAAGAEDSFKDSLNLGNVPAAERYAVGGNSLSVGKKGWQGAAATDATRAGVAKEDKYRVIRRPPGKSGFGL